MEIKKETGPDLLDLVVKKELFIELSKEDEIAYLSIDHDLEETLDYLVNDETYKSDDESLVNKILTKGGYTEEEKQDIINNWKKKKEEAKKAKTNKIPIQ